MIVRRGRRRLGAALVAGLVALLCAGASATAASAATVAAVIDDGLLIVVGTDGDDAITVSTTASDPSAVAQPVDVEDPAGLTAGAGCVQNNETQATCAEIQVVEVAGRDGDDTLVAGPNLLWPMLYGQGGADVISGAVEGYGGAGADDITAADSSYEIAGESGDDVLHAGATSTIAYGGAGDDQVIGGPGDDYLSGEDGDDVLRGEAPSAATAADSGTDFFDGGDGTDRVDYGGRTDALTVTAGPAWSSGNGAAGEGDELYLVEDVTGGAGDDRLTGGDGPNRLDGGDGADTLLARDGAADQVDCGDGADAAELDPLDVLASLPVPGGGCEHVVVAEYVPPPPPPEDPGTGDPGPSAQGPPPVTPPTVVTPPPHNAVPVPRPPRPPAPLRVVRHRALRHAQARVTVHVVPRGTLEATAVAIVDGRSLVIARGHAIALSNRNVTVTLRPTRAGRRAVRRHRTLAVGLRLRLAPHPGTKVVTLGGGAFDLRW